jgi:hypothetical protein
MRFRSQPAVVDSADAPLLVNLFKSDPLLPDEFLEASDREELSYGDLLQLGRIEDLYERWLRAKSINARSAAMHQAVLEIQPRIANVWMPMWRSRREDCARRRFRGTLQMISMLRQRGLGHLFFVDPGLIMAFEGKVSDDDVPPPQAPPRRCEGRSRAPGAAGGGSRRGGSRQGGGDRGDDSGGDGGSDSAGDGSGGEPPEPRFWRYLKRVGLIVGIASALYVLASGLTDESSEPHPAQKTIIVKKKVIVREFAPPEPANSGLKKRAKCRPDRPCGLPGSR